jgi:hypothetical protein
VTVADDRVPDPRSRPARRGRLHNGHEGDLVMRHDRKLDLDWIAEVEVSLWQLL